jgi:hypothetical protein
VHLRLPSVFVREESPNRIASDLDKYHHRKRYKYQHDRPPWLASDLEVEHRPCLFYLRTLIDISALYVVEKLDV